MTSCVDFIKELKKDMTEYEKIDLLFLISFSISHLANNTIKDFLEGGTERVDFPDAVSLEMLKAIKARVLNYPDGNLAAFMNEIKKSLEGSLKEIKVDLSTFIKYQ